MSSERRLFAEHAWDIPSGVELLQTTRYGGVSQAPYDSFNLALHVGDDSNSVLKNRHLLRQYLPSEPLWLNQVHGEHVLDADQEVHGTPDADAAVTTQAERVLVIMTADCLPVYFVDRQARVIGLAHAGWRGLAKGVLTKTWALMCEKVPDLKASDVDVFLGPAIGPQAFEVGQEVKDIFLLWGANRAQAFSDGVAGKTCANLYLLAAMELSQLGIGHIHAYHWCTYSQDQFYSFRRSKVTGRMASLLWIKKHT